jgi:isopenicillin-N N-acyltransferase-like protein
MNLSGNPDHPSRLTRYREITVSGSPLEMGRSIGEAARQEIRGFVEIALERVNKSVRISRKKAMEVARACIRCAEDYSADMMAELCGMAETAGVALDDLMLLQVRNQLKPEKDEGCSAFSLAPRTNALDGHVVGQNWDNDPALDPFTIVLTRRPRREPALMNITQAGLIAYMGLNDAGIGLCLNTLPAPSREVGVPHYFTVRGIYEADSLDGAVQAVQRANRAIPANILLATPQGPADLEVTVDNVHVLRDDGSGRVIHTNHCLHPDLLSINGQFPELIQSVPRKLRLEKLLGEPQPPLALEQLKAALSDHENYPKSICRHPNDDPITGHCCTVFSIIIEPEAARMYVTRGNPCCQPYETYQMS